MTEAAWFKETWFIPDTQLTTRLDDLASNHRSSTFGSIAIAFVDNLRGIQSTLSLPYQLIFAEVNNLHWQRFQLAARIRILPLPGDPAPTVEDEVAADHAGRKKFEEFVAGPGNQIIVDEVVARLNALHTDPHTSAAGRELGFQGIVLLWSAFEVLARDLFVAIINLRPELSVTLNAHSDSKKRFSLDRFDLATLDKFSYDLSRNMGTILAQKADLDDIHSIRDVFCIIFDDSSELAEALRADELWFLFQKRNLIVHRRGIVDDHYRVRMPGALLPGSVLTVKPSEVELFLAKVLTAGQQLLERAGALISA